MDDVLPLYNRELEFLRRQAGKFADAHPKVAGRLRIGPEMADDPHVERLIEAVALLNARVRLKLEDEFPELTEAVLNALYPHYLAPVPPMGIARLEASTALSEPYEVARGTELETGPIDGERCRLRTTQALTLWPFEVTQVGMQGRPFRAPVNPRAQGALSVLHIRLSTTNESATFGDLQPDPIRFYLGGAGARALPLYELLRNRLLGIAVCEQPDEPNTVFLPPSALKPVGFSRDEAILPYPSRSFVGYRLLTEYFALPQKFLFFEINGVSARMLAGAGRELSIYLYLADTEAELERGVTTADVTTGCVPVVNLFPLRAEPIRLDGTAFEHRIVPDARRPDALEVYAVDKVTASDVDGNEYPFEPFFGLRHDAEGEVRFWQVARRPAISARDKGNELFISLLDRDADAGAPANWTLSVDTLCFNRDLLARIPSVGGQVPLDLVSPSPTVRRAYMASPFSPTRRPPMGNGRMWRLLSHLSLNHLSMSGGEDGSEALREILRLYDWGQGLETRRLIDGVRSVNSKRGLARIVLGRSTAITQGLDVDVLLDPQNYPPGGAYLMACVLEHFFGLYVAVNTFTRLTARLSGRTGVLASWPPPDGREDPPLIERLREEPEAFDALQAILVLERHAARQGTRAGGGGAPIGGGALPDEEVLHFVSETALGFPVAELTQVRETPGGPPKVEITFMGMHGPSGVLPQAYSDKVLERQREKDTSLADFLDLFTHRSASFFIRAWKKYRLAAQVNSTVDELGPTALPSDLGIAGFVDAILGFSTGGLKGRLAPRHTALRFYAGAYAGNPRSAVVLESILSDYFGEKISVDTFVPHWERLPTTEQTQMTPTSFCRLGDEAVIGARVMRPEAKFRIQLGPLDYKTLRSFLPDQTRLRELVHLARLFVGEAMFFDVQLILRRDDVPPMQLGDWGGGDGARLGWNTWLTSVAPPTNPDDTILSCDAVP